jgi:thiol-disulfide isomerase/thioredoxin
MMVAVRLLSMGLVFVAGLPTGAHAAIGMRAPEIANEVWINSSPLRLADLKGKVVMVEFWTFGCYNCRNVEPYVKEWHRKYMDEGLVVIGIHSPEFAYEKNPEAVRQYVKDHDIHYSVTIDNEFMTWTRYGNRYWPAMYLIDKRGVIRYIRVGEGGYAETERLIQALLSES